MQSELRRYYEYGISATLAAQKTGINIKTVAKYFEEWSEHIIESESTAFFERQKKERARVITSLDLLIVESYALLDSVDSEIEKLGSNGKNASHLYGTKLGVMKFVADLIEKKTSFAMRPIMSEALKLEIEEMVKNTKTRQDN